MRYERAFTGAVPMNVWATVNGPTRSTSLLAGPDRTFLGRNDEHVRAVASCLLSSTRTFQPESRLFETGRMTSPSRGNLLFSIWSRFHDFRYLFLYLFRKNWYLFSIYFAEISIFLVSISRWVRYLFGKISVVPMKMKDGNLWF